MVSKNFSTSQISKILKISERSVTRIKRKLREERKQLKAEGKIPYDPTHSSDDEDSFKFLKSEEKLEKAKELFQQKLTVNDIAKTLKISERTARRWKERLTRLDILDIEPSSKYLFMILDLFGKSLINFLARSKKSQRSTRRQVVTRKIKDEHIEYEDDESFDSSDHSELDTLIEPEQEVKHRSYGKRKRAPKEEPMETGDDESLDSSDRSELDTLNEEDFNLDPPQDDEDDSKDKHASLH